MVVGRGVGGWSFMSGQITILGNCGGIFTSCNSDFVFILDFKYNSFIKNTI